MSSSSLSLASSTEPPSVTRTHCPYCAFQCGMRLESTETSQLRVSADAAFPVNRGLMCIKGFNSAALLDHDARITTPLLRDDRGELQAVSWKTALDFVVDKLVALRAESGPNVLGAFGSGALTNEKAYLLGKLVRVAFGSSQIDYNGRYCMASAAAGQNRAFGIDRGLPFPVSDIAETDTLLLWGANSADTMPPLMQWVTAQKDRGGTLIVVDPRRTETARLAHIHLQPTPGTDLALANCLLALAIERGHVDLEFVTTRTNGFETVRRSLAGYEPAHVERLTGVALADLVATVDALARVEKSMLLSGRGPEQQSKGADTVTAFTNLMLALGKVGKPASGYGCLTGQGNGQGGREHGQKADQLPGYRYIENAEDRAHVARVWGVPAESLPGKGKSAFEMLDGIDAPDGLRALVVFGSNLVVASPDSNRIREKLKKLDLLVVCDSFLNDTSELAHVVLPTKQWAEEDGTITNLEGRVLLRRRASSGPPGVKSDLEIIRELGARLGHADKFDHADAEAVFQELRRATSGGRADYAGIDYARLERETGVFWPCPDATHPGTPRLFEHRFAFPDGKARFHVVHHRPAGEEPDRDYPLFFTTGRYREHYNSGAQTRRVPKLIDAQPEPRLQMHPRLARRLDVEAGDSIEVESRRGRVTFTVDVNTEIRPDTLFAPFHWGGRAAANLLTNGALDPTSRMPEFKICAVRATSARATSSPPENASHS